MTALLPMMGWSTWNRFHQHISESIILEMAEAIKSKGLLDAGYCYINIDDYWQASQRDENARLCFDIGRFPSKEGIVKKLNNMGFKSGLYSSCGAYTCEDMPGSYGFEELDAKTFASWGVEYLKYDYCHVVDLPTSPHFKGENFAVKTPPILYIGISKADLNEIVILSKKAQISEPAYLKDEAVYNLDCPRASISFEADIPESGEYQIAVGYIKEYNSHRQFLLLSIQGIPTAQIWFPPTSAWNSPSRVMTTVELKKGRNILYLTNPIRGQKEDSILRYTKMGEALKKAAPKDKPIYYSICEHGRAKPWTWAGDLAASWRVCSDINPSWQGVIRSYEAAADLWTYQKPGAYNDPDMLEVGLGNLSKIENQSHFALWCMMNSPLVLGLDVRYASDDMLLIISNPELIAINQDKLMLQASRLRLDDDIDLLIKPLTDNRCAVCLFNKSEKDATGLTLDISNLHKQDMRVLPGKFIKIKDILNKHEWINETDVLEVSNIESHGVVIFVLNT